MNRKRELMAGCAICPSPIGPSYIPLVLSVLTYEGVVAGGFRVIRTLLEDSSNTPEGAFAKAREYINDKTKTNVSISERYRIAAQQEQYHPINRTNETCINQILDSERYLVTETRNIDKAIDYLRSCSQDPYNDLAIRDARNQTKVINRMLGDMSRTVLRIQDLKHRLEKL